jgi:hypothetical protein
MRRFLNDIPWHIGQAKEPEDLHTTIMYPEELARAGLGPEEESKLLEVSNTILTNLGELGIVGTQLEVVRNELKPYKKFYGIEIPDEEHVCGSIRKMASDVVFDALGIRLRTYFDSYHTSVAERFRSNGHKRPIKYHRHFPQELTVQGVYVGVKTAYFSSDGLPNNYVNRCYRERLGKRSRKLIAA